MLFAHEPVHLDPCSIFETGFTANEIQQLLSLCESPKVSLSHSSSPNSGSEGSNRTVYSVDERKRRRMISNRESARRSRWRKKRHQENLAEEVNRLKLENQGLQNRLLSTLNQCYVLRRENNWLRSESIILRATLSDLSHTLAAMQAMQMQQPQ